VGKRKTSWMCEVNVDKYKGDVAGEFSWKHLGNGNMCGM